MNMYDLDAHEAEIYDRTETQTDDVVLLRRLIGESGPLRILEPFCGTGRILIPLAEDGHELVGLDQAAAMLDCARTKAAHLPAGRVTLRKADVTAEEWPTGFDLVVLGGNCFYELASAELQERCIAFAARALNPGGFVYLDNDHMEGDLDPAWCEIGVCSKAFPRGICSDGVRIEGTSETVWFDAPGRLWRSRRTVTLIWPDGRQKHHEWVQQKHPPSAAEMQGSLQDNGFEIEHTFGDRLGNPYTDSSDRAIFWARKTG